MYQISKVDVISAVKIGMMPVSGQGNQVPELLEAIQLKLNEVIDRVNYLEGEKE